MIGKSLSIKGAARYLLREGFEIGLEITGSFASFTDRFELPDCFSGANMEAAHALLAGPGPFRTSVDQFDASRGTGFLAGPATVAVIIGPEEHP